MKEFRKISFERHNFEDSLISLVYSKYRVIKEQYIDNFFR